MDFVLKQGVRQSAKAPKQGKNDGFTMKATIDVGSYYSLGQTIAQRGLGQDWFRAVGKAVRVLTCSSP